MVANPETERCAMLSFELTLYLFDRFGRPALLLGDALQVLHVNRAAATAFGWDTENALGATLGTLVDVGNAPIPPEDEAFTSREGAILCDVHALTPTGHRVPQRAELRALDPETPMYLMELFPTHAAHHSRPPPHLTPSSFPAASRPEVSRFEIDTSAESFGTVFLAEPLPLHSPTWVGSRCYSLLFDRDAPCEGCPALALSKDILTATGIIQQDGTYHIVRATRVGPHAARMRSNPLDEDIVRSLVAARLDALAREAGLSERERGVFELLAMGRILEEIATVLGITARTVRFHQANLLEKLGADSRLDLLRLLL
jgi:DNA-binding CsgD family transcriptional regulator